MKASTVFKLIKKANQPGPPVNVLVLRIGITLGLLIGLAAVTHEREITFFPSALASVGIIAGMIFSYITRKRPIVYLKILLAALAVFAMYQFVERIIRAASEGNLPSLIAPVAGLFVWIQLIHSWDVPALRDLLFSLVGSATFILIAAANAVDSGFFIFFGLWVFITFVNLVILWLSQIKIESTPNNPRFARYAESPVRAFLKAVISIMVGSLMALTAILVVPAPKPVQSIQLPESLHLRQALSVPGQLYDGGNLGNQPAQALPPSSRIGIGGFIGFGNQLDTGIRARFSNTLIMRVRATTPGYFLGMTFGKWDGQSWSQTSSLFKEIGGSSPFYVGNYFSYFDPQGTESIQTYYLAQALPNLIFAEDTPEEIFFPDFRIFLGQGRTLTTGVGMEPGTIYTVISRLNNPTVSQLTQDQIINSNPTYGLSFSEKRLYTSLPKPYRRVKELVLKITKGRISTEGKIIAIEHWLSTHTKYTLGIPPLASGQDAVDQFLFVTKRGYCEQISTALAVMLRTIGIPTREAVGYVPGSFNPLTDLWEVRAKDAHAWVQVWFGPKYGWQNVDPTLVVPLANPNPGGVLLSYVSSGFKKIPLFPVGLLIAVVLIVVLCFKVFTRPRKSWSAKQFKKLEKLGKRYGIVAKKSDTPWRFSKKLSVALSQDNKKDAQKMVDEIMLYLLRESYDPDFTLEKQVRKEIKKKIGSLTHK
jgi:transglutaminase-like putative cysteine protease